MRIYKVDAGFWYEGAYISYLYKHKENAEEKLLQLEREKITSTNPQGDWDWVESSEVKLEDD